MKPMDLKQPIGGETLDDHLKNYKHQPWQEFYHRFTDDIHNSTLTDVLMGYHEWLQSRGMIREVEKERGCQTCCYRDTACEPKRGKCTYPMWNGWSPLTTTEVDPDSRTITIRDAGDVAPAPTVEMVRAAYAYAEHNGTTMEMPSLDTIRCSSPYIREVLRILYPSAFKE